MAKVKNSILVSNTDRLSLSTPLVKYLRSKFLEYKGDWKILQVYLDDNSLYVTNFHSKDFSENSKCELVLNGGENYLRKYSKSKILKKVKKTAKREYIKTLSIMDLCYYAEVKNSENKIVKLKFRE